MVAQYLGSYTARLAQHDHVSSRGRVLGRAMDILQQDRANYYRFGIRDREDSGAGYFQTRLHRARMGRMIRQGNLTPSLAREIVSGTPLVAVGIYSDHLDVRRVAEGRNDEAVSQQWSMPSTPAAAQTLRSLLSRDAIGHVRDYARSHEMGFGGRVLKQRLTGVYFAREGDRDVAWVVVATSPRTHFDCHACVPVLSVLAYRKEGANGWRLYAYGYEASTGTSGWDMMPGQDDMALVHLSPEHVALAIRSSYANMGWGMEYYEIVSVEGSRGRRLFHTTMSENNGGNITPIKTDWENTLRFAPVPGHAWYDIRLHRQGTYRGKAIDYTVTYRYRNGKYDAQSDDEVMQEK